MSGGRPLSERKCPRNELRNELYAEIDGAGSKSSVSVKATVEVLIEPLPRRGQQGR